MRPLFLAVFGGLAIVVVAVSAFLLLRDRPTGPAPGGTQVIVEDANLIGGPFVLTDENGNRFTDADALGKPTAIFFGFSHCPDVCPTTLYELSVLLGQLGADADRLNVLFVSVDYERDGPEEVAAYTSVFDPRIVGLAGTAEEIAAATSAYRVYYEKIPLENGGYTIDHTASVYLMDSDGRFVGTLAHGENMAVRLQKLQALIADA
ncbi:MAG: SCO family protein [Bauldia sp.]|nr:SCO family protein [Bauldia sp.]